jgi:hypothetical protein
VTDYRTPEGKRAWYCTTAVIHVRQHLSLDTPFPTESACGHLTGHWSSQELRTPIGITCRTCIRNVTKHGRHKPLFGAWVMLKAARPIVWVMKRFQKPAPVPEVLSTEELFSEPLWVPQAPHEKDGE